MSFDQEIIDLHHIARKIESEIGVGQLSQDLRSVADRLSELTRVEYVQSTPFADSN